MCAELFQVPWELTLQRLGRKTKQISNRHGTQRPNRFNWLARKPEATPCASNADMS